MVSVIIPAYNIAPFLVRCVNSILNQTYRNLEVLLVDDGSTDDTPAICDRLAQQDARVRVFHKENGGVSSARNLALDNCRGDYISFIDGDDWVEPTLYEDAVNAMQENGVDVFMFEYFIDTPDGAQVHSVDPSCYGKIDREMTMLYSITPHNRFAWSKVISKKLLLTNPLPGQIRFDSSIILGEDTLFIEQALLGCKGAVYTPKPYYHYDQREGSATRSSFNEKKLSGLTSYQKVCQLLHENGLHTAEKQAWGALLNLGFQLGIYVAQCDSDVQKRVYPQIEAFLKPVRRKVVMCRELDRHTKLKALLSMVSLPGSCKLLNRKR